MPLDTIAPPSTEASNFKVEGRIKIAVSNEKRLRHDSVEVAVSDDRVMLDGEVSNHDHRYVAIRIAINYAGTRTLVDNLRLRGER
jgi:osmotically-inducible protein OsmY